jgi:hypothetical protein
MDTNVLRNVGNRPQERKIQNPDDDIPQYTISIKYAAKFLAHYSSWSSNV